MPPDDLTPADAIGLPALSAQVRRDLERLAYPAKPWVDAPPPATLARLGLAPGQEVLDCAIVGGGQFGLTIAHGLQRECVQRVRVFDRNPRGQEGPWSTFARMKMLRTPKDPTGHDLGNASLTFRAWYEAQHGADGWQRLFRISRPDWQAYLGWYRDVTGVDVRNEVAVTAVEPWPSAAHAVLFRLTLQDAAGKDATAYARTVVFASGAEGSGGHAVPDVVSRGLPPALVAHTSDWPVDFSRFAGQRIGLLGGGAAAFDTAIAALEAGAREAVLCFRRPALPLANPRRWMEFCGFLAHYPELPDAQRWAYMHTLFRIGQPPPVPTFERAVSLPGFTLRPGTPWLATREEHGQAVVTTPQGEERFDFVFVATGAFVDLAARPEFAGLLPHVALWGERFTPSPALAEPRLAAFPYLGRFGQFTEKVPGTAPWVERLFTITRAATLSLGPSAASNSNIKYTAPRLISGVTRALFLSAADEHFVRFQQANHDELAADAVARVGGLAEVTR
ncbi:FAD/NAD(P)-binding protein [Aquabacterium sp. J223]|uniref:FAD/NAD(P)-binding protein n=1 Tax=Aquabacterium sp. J223 TaxID=2898431 RepID=UPI0021ADAF95|nr:NAD(P)/FAD-dependent oxidoreductase [Aquabacterium sp. J223]UUX95414.1 NAD(P)/FAD-dependent oxidoreductase [Aquabacterium sp. J223]